MQTANLQSPTLTDSRAIKLPKDYTVGVRCTTFEGMLMYQGKPFLLGRVFHRWSEIETMSLRQLVCFFRNGEVYFARKKAPVIKRRRNAAKQLPAS